MTERKKKEYAERKKDADREREEEIEIETDGAKEMRERKEDTGLEILKEMMAKCIIR